MASDGPGVRSAVLRAVTDRFLLGQWVEASLAYEPFWDSKPRWIASVGRRQVTDELVVWSERSLFTVNSGGSALAIHFDGTLTLADLVDDVVAAVDAPVATAQHLVAVVSLELHGRGAVLGVNAPEPPQSVDIEEAEAEPAGDARPETGETFRIDPVTGAKHRIVTEIGPSGDMTSTEHLPDGRRIITTTLTIGGDDHDVLLAAQAAAGGRSLAELVPADSCLGSKLRNDDAVPLVTIRCADGRPRSIRCHHPEVADVLRERAGPGLEPSATRGPIEAFVVTPLEGDGPVRIFDGQGRRRGRPRTVMQAVEVVDQIPGERTVAESGRDDSADVLALPFQLIGGHDGHGVLVPPDALEGVGLVSRLTEAGWVPTWGDVQVTADGVRHQDQRAG